MSSLRRLIRLKAWITISVNGNIIMEAGCIVMMVMWRWGSAEVRLVTPFCDGHTNGLECCRSTYGGTMFAIKSMLTEEMVFTLVLVAIFVDVCNSFDSEIYISQSEIKNTESTVPSFRKLKLKHH